MGKVKGEKPETSLDLLDSVILEGHGLLVERIRALEDDLKAVREEIYRVTKEYCLKSKRHLKDIQREGLDEEDDDAEF